MTGRREHLLQVQNLAMCYGAGKPVLRDVSLSVAAGEFVAILGSNGCGKSTLLRCISRIHHPTAGEVRVDGHNLAHLSGSRLRQARRSVAMIFQQSNLIKRRSVLANVATGALGHHPTVRTSLGFLPRCELEQARDYLAAVGLDHLAEQRAGTLSGGQAQRVAISRALAQRPKVLLADEPVASLDPQAAEEIMGLLGKLARRDGLAVLCVLHQPNLAARYADRILGIWHGQVAFDLPPSAVSSHQVATLYTSAAA